ncbi:MAG: DNA internalization-related competence protein ComEC/Rec2, partial [Balneolaceae bacterium]
MNRDYSYRFPFASYPALRLAVLLMAGIAIATILAPPVKLIILIILCSFLMWIISESRLRFRWPLIAGTSAVISYLILFLSSAILYTQFHIDIKENRLIPAEKINLFEWDHITVEGEVKAAGRSSSGQPVIEMIAYQSIFGEELSWDIPYRLRLTDKSENDGVVAAGDQIRSVIRVYGFPERRNPHEFDYGKWLNRRGIAVHGEIIEWNRTVSVKRFSWSSVRSKIQHNADRLFSEKHSDLAKALLLGYKEDLTFETKQHFSRSGLSHIMAVSGLHVGFIVAPFWLMIPYIWGSKRGRWSGLILLTILLIGYAGITGFSASVSRASLMAWFLTFGKLFHKIRNSINLTAVAAIIILLIDPSQLFEIGFQLSFSAVMIILLILPEAQQMIPAKYRHGFVGGLISIVLVSIVVQIGLYPILVHYFGEFSIVGPIANALVVPILSFTVPAGLLFVLLSPLSFDILQAGGLPIQLSLDWVNWVAGSLGGHPLSYLVVQERTVSIFLIWFVAILFITAIRISTIRWKLLALLLLTINGYFIEKQFKKPLYKELEIVVLDVGQADAIHIRTPNDFDLLIDTGRWSPMGNSGEQVLIPYFEYRGIEKLDAVILSHPHADHIGGMPDLMDHLKIDAIYQSDYEYDSALYQTIMEKADDLGIPIFYPVAGEQIEIDPAIRIFVLGPEQNANPDRNPNNHSVAVKIVYGDRSFLFTGDAEVYQENQMVNRYGDFLDSDVYKAGHHGSNTSSTATFMNLVQPDISVASLAFRNGFGHPGRDAVYRLHQYGRSQKFTSLEGAILIVSDGRDIK